MFKKIYNFFLGESVEPLPPLTYLPQPYYTPIRDVAAKTYGNRRAAEAPYRAPARTESVPESKQVESGGGLMFTSEGHLGMSMGGGLGICLSDGNLVAGGGGFGIEVGGNDSSSYSSPSSDYSSSCDTSSSFDSSSSSDSSSSCGGSDW